MESDKILCGASRYDKKFYINPRYSNLPKAVQDELRIMCVLFVEEVSGVIILRFNDNGNLEITVTADDNDYYYDEIGSRLKIKQMQKEKEELFRQLEEYYDAFGY